MVRNYFLLAVIVASSNILYAGYGAIQGVVSLNTFGNTVGLEAGDKCRYNSYENSVTCQGSGRVFKNVRVEDLSSDDTRNYIGYYLGRPMKNGIPGVPGKRFYAQ